MAKQESAASFSGMKDWEKCYVMSQMLKRIDIMKPGAADLPTLIPEIARLLEWAATELSPRGEA